MLLKILDISLDWKSQNKILKRNHLQGEEMKVKLVKQKSFIV